MSTKSQHPIIAVETKKNKGAEIIYITRSTKGTELEEPIDLTNCVLFERKETSKKVDEIYIRHPFLSNNFSVTYIEENEFFDYGKDILSYADLSFGQITATLYEKKGTIIGFSGNGGPLYHKKNGCERERLHIPTGQGYDLCKEGCHWRNHSEISAIRKIKKYGKSALLKGANAYLYGHWWSCVDCSTAMEKAGITKLFLSKEWTREFLEM